MAAARSYGQQPISHVLQPIRRRWVTIGHRISVPPPGSCGGARAAAADFAAEEKRAAAAAARRGPKAPRRLITISTADGRWQGEWNCDYVFTLRELGLGDVADLGQADAAVLIRLLVQKHAGFGFSVEGKIATCFPRKCSGCLSTFDKEIDASFDVWVLPSSRSDPAELPEIGSGDPSVIYVKPGTEADLDSLIRDTIRLAVTANAGACSLACEKSSPRWNYIDDKKGKIDSRWARLLEIRDVLSPNP
ncbi:E3 ubiquitin-protein ligase, putative (DUF177) isoform X1 [Wolffia australiana]